MYKKRHKGSKAERNRETSTRGTEGLLMIDTCVGANLFALCDITTGQHIRADTQVCPYGCVIGVLDNPVKMIRQNYMFVTFYIGEFIF